MRAAGAESINYGKELELFLTRYRPTDKHPYDEALLPELLTHFREKNYDNVLKKLHQSVRK